MATNPGGDGNGGWKKRIERNFVELLDGSAAGIRRHFVNAIIVVAGIYDWLLFLRATEKGNYFVSQATVLAGVVLIFAGIARLTNTFSLAQAGTRKSSSAGSKEDDGEKPDRDKKRSDWLVRLVLLAALGLCAIVLYAIQYEHWNPGRVASIASVGFMAGGAAWLVGALLGFLFGIPHTQVGATDSGKQNGTAGQATADDKTKAGRSDNRYVPSTSLEQISDWLTKIIVGVGLTQLNQIPPKLDALALYLSKGMCGDESSKTFALSITLYFSVCGFFFGYLWARLYMLEAFRAADEVEALKEEISQIANQPQADAKALSLTNRLLNRQAADPVISDEEVAQTIKAASVPVKIQLFNQAERAAETNADADDYDVKIEGAIAILKGLIADDPTNRFHRNYSELSYALRKSKPPKWKEAADAMTKAIEIRDRMGKKGWRYYEFHRAWCRIEQIENFRNVLTTDPALKEQILGDLRIAYTGTEPTKWAKWRSSGSSVGDWMTKNGIAEANLVQVST